MSLLQPLQRLLHAMALDERRCMLCHVPFVPAATGGTEEGLALCPACRKRLRPYRGCTRCGAPILAGEAETCPSCRENPPPWQNMRCCGLYAGALKRLLLQGKFGADPVILHFLGQLLARSCRDLKRPDAIIPIPLHINRLRERGFNQCQELARPLSKALAAPLLPRLLLRTLPTRHQVGLSGTERAANLNHAFRAAPEVRRKRLLLIDDACTTGTTLYRACEALLEAGATAVDVAVIARTPREHLHSFEPFAQSAEPAPHAAPVVTPTIQIERQL